MTVTEALNAAAYLTEMRCGKKPKPQGQVIETLAAEVKRLQIQRGERGVVGPIAGVAVKHLGKVWQLPWPCRHCHVLQAVYQALGEHTWRDGEERSVQGFVTAAGEFLDRKQAAALALSSGQIKALRWPPDLYSEDLW